MKIKSILKCCNVALPFGGNTHKIAAAYARELAEQNKLVYVGHSIQITRITGASCAANLEIILSAPVKEPVYVSKSYNVM